MNPWVLVNRLYRQLQANRRYIRRWYTAGGCAYGAHWVLFRPCGVEHIPSIAASSPDWYMHIELGSAP